MLSSNLNFRQAVSKELLKVTIVCDDTPFLPFLYWSRYASIQLMSQKRSDATGIVVLHVMLFHCLAHIRSFCELIGKPLPKCFISKKNKSNFWLWELVHLQPKILKTKYCWKNDFLSLQGTFPGELDEIKVTYSNFFRTLCTKIVQIGSPCNRVI